MSYSHTQVTWRCALNVVSSMEACSMVNLGFDGENGMTIDAEVPDLRVTLSKRFHPNDLSGDWYQCDRIQFVLAVQNMVLKGHFSDKITTVNKKGNTLTFPGGHSIELYGPNGMAKSRVPLPVDNNSLLCSEFILDGHLTSILYPLTKPPLDIISARGQSLLIRKDDMQHQIPSTRVSLKGFGIVGEITNQNPLWVQLLAELNKKFCLKKMMLLYESTNLHFCKSVQLGQADVTGFQLNTIDESCHVTLRIANKQHEQESDQEMDDEDDDDDDDNDCGQPLNKRQRVC